MYRHLGERAYRDSTVKRLLPGGEVVILATNEVARQEHLTVIPDDLNVEELRTS